MATYKSRVRLAALALACASMSVAVRAETFDYKPSRIEVMQLPRFCWGQFLGKAFPGPQYHIAGCGYLMNHYCPGLVDLEHANRTFGNVPQKRAFLLTAKDNTLYTLRGMKGYPSCPLRTHAETTLRIINDELNALH